MTQLRLKYAHLVPHVWTSLERETRKGWVRSGVIDPETVAEHTLDLLRLGSELASEVGLADADRIDLLDMLEVHDWPEAIEGDEITMYGIDHAKEADAKKAKFLREEAAMKGLCAPLGEQGEHILALWHRFERGDDPIAMLGRELDKYQAIERAFRYEREGRGPQGLGEEFVRYSPPMTHPVLIARVAQLQGATR